MDSPLSTTDAMDDGIAYSNGHFVPADQLLVSPQDSGFLLGVTVSEQLRTFGGRLFEPKRHSDRLQASLDTMGLDEIRAEDLLAAAQKVSDHNHGLLDAGDDLGVTIFVTPGLHPNYRPDEDGKPTIGIHSHRLPFRLWAEKYEIGQHCRFVSVPQVNAACWPRALKCRSRMHYYRADREARQVDPNSRAILLDELGHVNEASTANIIAYFASEGLVSPPIETILPGVSLQFAAELASELSYKFTFRMLHPDELAAADELLLASTPFCILPVSKLDDRELPNRDCFRRLIKAWSDRVGFDIPAQARSFA